MNGAHGLGTKPIRVGEAKAKASKTPRYAGGAQPHHLAAQRPGYGIPQAQSGTSFQVGGWTSPPSSGVFAVGSVQAGPASSAVTGVASSPAVPGQAPGAAAAP